MHEELIERFKKEDVEFLRNVHLSRYSSIGIGGNAPFICFPDNEDKLINLIRFLKAHRLKFFIAGRLSNVLIDDNGFDGIIVKTDKINKYNAAENIVDVSCGCAFSKLLVKLSEFSLGGYEELFGIPGSVGGMIYSNAGAYGKEISESLISVRIYDVKDDSIKELSPCEMAFSYRSSRLKCNQEILLSAKMKFKYTTKEIASSKMMEILSKRKAAQPYNARSLGSAFKRHPYFHSVSLLIDNLGLKGLACGGCEISDKHAGFIVNKEHGRAKDYLSIAEMIKQNFYLKYGVMLEEEFEYIRSF